MVLGILSIVVAVLVYMVIGMIWYSNFGFAKAWIKAVGFKKNEMDKAKEGMAKTMVKASILALILSAVFQYLVVLLGQSSLNALGVGIIIWIGFIATTFSGMVLWEKKPLALYYINVFYYLFSFIAMGVVFELFI